MCYELWLILRASPKCYIHMVGPSNQPKVLYTYGSINVMSYGWPFGPAISVMNYGWPFGPAISVMSYGWPFGLAISVGPAIIVMN